MEESDFNTHASLLRGIANKLLVGSIRLDPVILVRALGENSSAVNPEALMAVLMALVCDSRALTETNASRVRLARAKEIHRHLTRRPAPGQTVIDSWIARGRRRKRTK